MSEPGKIGAPALPKRPAERGAVLAKELAAVAAALIAWNGVLVLLSL